MQKGVPRRPGTPHAAFILFCVFAAAPACAQTFAIRAGHLIDPSAGTVSENQIILVQDKKIADVGPNIAIPKDAAVINLSNEWVMPGIMDAHTHVTQSVRYFRELDHNYLVEPTGFRSLRGLRTAQILLNAGITTIRDVGNDANFAAVDLRKAIDRGWFVGPTVQTAGKIIAPFGGQSSGIPQEIGPFWRFEYYDADSPEEIRHAVRENIFYGADLIKLVADNSPYHYSVEELRAAVDETHHAGRPVAVHVQGGEAADNVIAAGVDSIEHGFFLTDAQLQKMKRKGIFLVGTDIPRAQLDLEGTSGGIFPPPEVLAPKIIDRLRRAYRLGVKMAFGTDTVIEVPNKSRSDLMLDYLAVWRDAGVPAPEILKCMTTNAAELLHVNQQRGTLAPGQAADIVAMPASPMEDVESLRKINFVMKDGKIIRRP